jgi:hypothetical protein
MQHYMKEDSWEVAKAYLAGCIAIHCSCTTMLEGLLDCNDEEGKGRIYGVCGHHTLITCTKLLLRERNVISLQDKE